MKNQPIKTHAIRHIWATYAKNILAENPTYWTRTNNCAKYDTKILRYNENGRVEEVDSYTRFRKIIECFFEHATTAIINGEALSIPYCGKICAKRVQRDFRNKVGPNARKKLPINWAKTKEQPLIYSEERQKMVYSKIIRFTDDDYCRIGWFKPSVENESLYEFAPSGSSNKEKTTLGFRQQLTIALNTNPVLKYRYLFCPIKQFKNNGVPSN